ncbi:MAG TPA: hypothetical protein VMT30_00300 [Candidatus Saccharimonadia bacterium]|nr:hypothetical protein [Candidatus Saccharimonadia bacterium]
MQQPKPSNFPPNPALQRFSPIIGTWDTTGTHGMIPGTILHGRTSFEWHDGFIRMNSSIQEPVGIPAGLAVIGSDDELDTYTMQYYDTRGVSRNYSVSIQHNVMKWWRDASSFSQRYSLTISANGRTMTGKGELSKDGSNWEKDLDLDYQKVKG